MSDPAFGEISREHRGEWVRLRTLTYLRTLAVAGQAVALFLATQWFGLQFEMGLVGLAIGASVVSILLALFLFPQNKRLSDTEAMLTFLFDIAQLACMLYLTGGITNPFALLVIAPVAISATALKRRSTMILGVVAIALITLVAITYRPMQFSDGTLLVMPELFAFGYWVAIVIGIVFQAFYAHRVAHETNAMADALLAAQIALSREQTLTDLGGVVAATAHELGTPLATIKLIAGELADELSDRPELAEDVRLLREQADRCRDILRSMGRAGKEDRQLRQTPLEALLSEAAEPHRDRGKEVRFLIGPASGSDAAHPIIQRRPEMIHGLRNLIQNAVDFAESRVWIVAQWSDRDIQIRVIDDGAGFAPHVLAQIGEPFIRRRRDAAGQGRRGYEGMGLGLFIAKTLLERSGARLEFANCTGVVRTLPGQPDLRGALVELVWPRARIEAPNAPLGQNAPILG